MRFNKNLELVIGDKENFILNKKRNLTDFKTKILESDIKLIKSNLSSTMYDKRMRILFWDELFYYELILKSNERIFISCLLCDEIFEHFPNVKNEKIKRIFPIIKIEKTVGNNS